MKFHFFVLIMLLVPLSLSSKQIKFIVTGRVISADGAPVVNAHVVITPPGPVGELVYFVKTDLKGIFRFEGEYPGGREILYVTSPLPEHAHIPLIPPFNRVDPTYNPSGKKIRVLTGKETNLGDIRVQTEYKCLNLHLKNQEGNPLLNIPKNWEDVWIRIRERSGKIVAESGLSEKDRQKAVDLKDSAIRVALPEGVWRIDVAPNGLDTHWYSSGLVRVSESGPLNVMIKCK
jgi:hypothetical protein